MTKYDALFMGVAREEGSIAGVLTAFFDFLHRNTDFYVVSDNPQRKMGFAPGQAEALLLQSFHQFPTKPLEGRVSDAPTHTSPAATGSAPTPAVSFTTTTQPPKAAQIAMTPEGKQIPVGNGGSTATYTWTQSLRDVTVYLDVPVGTKSKDVAVTFTHTTVSAGLRGQTPLLHGTFPYKIKLEDTVWSLDSSRVLLLSIEKTTETWWKSVVQVCASIFQHTRSNLMRVFVKGDAEIDTSQVDSTQRIDEYDPETQGAIRKIMHEQRHGGRITSGENQPTMSFPTSLDME
ncbi:hypothetical protein H310_03766 [Aphanomyces invadans]|uniref:CS domain-containing protein n=1 Tax=Aphanomyces invadans TaxID=157072 RepID=A0A024UKN6_9STRA|nr:hypothetical protein H310_03766 [Aphanomyces invadans]ETW06193.1 hypothetical protein H310_03766 [Aphanomyces invadans]|eukprot:XP_008865970.1 hypothetical protein H310_03766 [Aphanomyces invadans]